jgi:hypothetical protein
MSIMAVVVAAPLMAQSMRLTASVPFEFTVAGKILPAGEYSISTGSNSSLLLIQGEREPAAALALAQRESPVRTGDPASITKLVFNKYGDRYFLSKVVNGYADTALAIPMTRAERELAKTASAERFEVLATLARR